MRAGTVNKQILLTILYSILDMCVNIFEIINL